MKRLISIFILLFLVGNSFAKNADFFGVREVVATKGGAGVYDLGTTLGKYVGQSKDIMGRVTSHFAKGGKLSAGELNNAVFHSMPGSTKLQREVYEQFLINKYGINNLLNVRNPMGGRMDLYNSMVDDVIKQFGLPR